MVPTQYRLEVESLEQLKERIAREFGPNAKVVSAEWVSQGGLGKFMAKRFIEAIVEIPDEEPGAPPSPVVLRRAMKTVAAVRANEPPEPTPGSGSVPATHRRPTPRPSAAGAPTSLGAASGLNALLEQADVQEELLATPGSARRRGTSSNDADFGRLLDGESFALEPATGGRAAGPRVTVTSLEGISMPEPASSRPAPQTPVAGPPASGHRNILPSPLNGPGDLVVVIGLWGDGVTAGIQLGEETAMRRQAGELAPKFDADPSLRRPIMDRRGIMRARAAAVEEAVPLVVSVALNPLQPLGVQLEVLDSLGADQLWVAVDAGRKSEDTAAWVKYISSRHRVYALVSLHANETLSPESVLDLGFPVFDVTAPVP